MKRTIFEIIKTVADEFSLPPPVTVVTSQDASIRLLLAFAKAVNDDLLAEQDWQALQTTYSFTTTNGVSQYAFPTDISRWISGTFFDQTNRWELQGPLSPRQWVLQNVWQTTGAPFERFRVAGDKIELLPVPGSTPITFMCEYISENTVIDGSTQLPKAAYTQDSDYCRFDPRVVIYGIKLKWMAAKGMDTTVSLAEYKRALEQAKGADAPKPRLSLVPSCGTGLLSTKNIPLGSWNL